MTDRGALDRFIAGARVDPAVFALRPDYRVMVVAVAGITAGPPDQASETVLSAAESAATAVLTARAAQDIPQITAWRDAYRAFGAHPQRTRNILAALVRQAASGGAP